MLRRVKDFENYILRATDGEIGKAKDFLFDDEKWTVRYLVAETGSWLTSRKVLISPHALKPAIEDIIVIPVNLTKKQIEDSPALESDQPVSRQFEEKYYSFYGWPYYSGGSYLWGSSPYLYGAGPTTWRAAESYSEELEAAGQKRRDEEHWDPCLRSTREVTGYHVQALDGEIGHVDGFIIDEDNWSIRYLIVDTKNWWPGKVVIVAPQWIERVSWGDRRIFVSLSKEAILESPEYLPEALSRDYESKLYAHYHSSGYWENQSREGLASADLRKGQEVAK
jgi:hypothetical protein